MRRGRVRWVVALSYAALVLTVSSIPSDRFPVSTPLNADKFAHLIEYAILAFLICRAVGRKDGRALALIAAACIAFGALDELHQHLIPGRCPSVWDAAADGIGTLAGIMLWRRFRSSREKNGGPGG